MKEEIEEMKSRNGNNNFSTKDLVWYLVRKVDELNANFPKQINICNGRFATKKTLYWSVGLLATAVTGLVSIILLVSI